MTAIVGKVDIFEHAGIVDFDLDTEVTGKQRLGAAVAIER